MRTINASEFKAKCLAILDEVSATGEEVTILKRGRAVARLTAPLSEPRAHPQEALRGTVAYHGDVVGPALPAEAWNAERDEPA